MMLVELDGKLRRAVAPAGDEVKVRLQRIAELLVSQADPSIGRAPATRASSVTRTPQSMSASLDCDAEAFSRALPSGDGWPSRRLADVRARRRPR